MKKLIAGAIIVLAAFAIGGYGTIVSMYEYNGDILTDILFRGSHPAIDEAVKGDEKGFEKIQGFGVHFSEETGYSLPLTGDYLKIIQTIDDSLRRHVQRRLGKDADVASIADFPNFRFRDGELTDRSYTHESVLEHFDHDAFREEVLSDEGVSGVFADTTLDIFKYYIITPEKEVDEELLIRSLAEVGRDETYSDAEWLATGEIVMKPMFFFLSWMAGRVQLDHLIRVFTIVACTIGLLFFVFFTFLLRMRSVRHAVAGVGMIFLSFLWMRAGVWLLNITGLMAARTTVFIPMPDVVTIVASVSVIIHIFEGYRNTSTGVAGLSRKESSWLMVAAYTIAIAANVTLFYWRPIPLTVTAEIGALSIFGIIVSLLFGILLFPLICNHPWWRNVDLDREFNNPILRILSQKLDAFFDWNPRILVPFGIQNTKIVYITAITTVVLAVSGVTLGLLQWGSEPANYLEATDMGKDINVLNSDGRGCFSDLDLYYEGDPWVFGDHPTHNARFLSITQKYQLKLDELNGHCSVLGLPAGSMMHLSQELFQKDSPETDEEMEYVVDYMGRTPDKFQRLRGELEDSTAFRMIVFHKSVQSDPNNPQSLRDLYEAAFDIISDPGVSVVRFGRTTVYWVLDTAVYLGKIPNFFQTTSIVFGILFIVLLGLMLFGFMSHIRWWGVPWLAAAGTIPFVVSTAFLTLVMITFRIPMDIATAAISEVSLNASVDFTIYMLYTLIRTTGIHSSFEKAADVAVSWEGGTVAADAWINKSVFPLLLFTSIGPIFDLGLMIILMLFVAMVTVFTLVPSLFRPVLK